MNLSNRRADTVAIRKLMVEKGYKTIKQLSEDADISRVTLGKILDGKVQPSAEVMSKLVDTLRIPPSEAGQIFFAINLPNK